MPQVTEPVSPENDLRETLLAVRAKLKIALHLARDRAGRAVGSKQTR